MFFNVSHSQDLAVYALCLDAELGVDVERLRAIANVKSIAEEFFSPQENAVLARMKATTEAFFHCWTRKEALLKAVGAGLSATRCSFTVPVRPDALPCILRLPSAFGASDRWSLHELQPSEGYVGAVAISGEEWQVAAGRYV